MCGIFGVASTRGMSLADRRRDVFHNGLVFNMLRGWESTGVALVRNVKNDNQVLVYKRALNAVDFFDTKQAQRLMRDFKDYHFAIGHCRASTRGAAEDNNAHPFMYDHITLVHNGTIDPALLMGRADEPVDSAAIALSMAKDGEKETLENLEGPFSIVWYNHTNDTLNFARNKRKPMTIAFVEGENTMYFGSEWATTVAAAIRNNESLEHPINVTKPFIWYQFNKTDLRKFVATDFKEYSRPFTRPHGVNSQWGQNRQLPITVHGQASSLTTKNDANTTSQSSETSQTISNSKEGSKSSPVIGAQIETREDFGSPTSADKIRSAVERLARVGLSLHQLVMMEPKIWSPYKNQRGKTGIMSGNYINPHDGTCSTLEAEMYNVPIEQWNSYRETRKVACRIVNVRGAAPRGGSVGTLTLVVALDSDWNTVLSRGHSKSTDAANKEVSQKEEPKEGPNYEEKGTEEIITLKGPGGSRISLAKFRELTKLNCGECDGPVDPNHHEKVIWVGDSPVCHVCSADDDVLKKIGTGDSGHESVRVH